MTSSSHASTHKSVNENSYKSQFQNSSIKLGSNDDEKSRQSKLSIFSGILYSLCLNLTYANLVRFPREVDHYGSIFLIAYFILFIIIGIPVVILKVSIGQFLGQDASKSWRSAPLLKGAAVLARFGSFLITIWVALQSVLALIYIGMLIFKPVPFGQCASLKQNSDGYQVIGKDGQQCLSQTFLTPLWEDSSYFIIMMMGLLIIWISSMIWSNNGKVFKKSIFVLALITLLLLSLLTGWEIVDFILKKSVVQIWQLKDRDFLNPSLWFNALTQLLLSLHIGSGTLPVLTGKHLTKSDAIRTSYIYLLFNILIVSLSTIFFSTQHIYSGKELLFAELKPFTDIYDRALALEQYDPLLSRVIPGLAYLMIFLSAAITMGIALYTMSKFFSSNSIYVLTSIGIILSICSLAVTQSVISRLLDTRIIGTITIMSLIFNLIGLVWIYGTKNILIDLEFSIGRHVSKIWVKLWLVIPIILLAIITWWTIFMVPNELLIDYLPRWSFIVIALIIIIAFAFHMTLQQVGYNFWGMIKESMKPSQDWGPADPIIRSSWKQWKSVCDDTGARDFTLRRKGTRDYTNSIKRNQKRLNETLKRENHMSNCNISVGDSAIEEDLSVGKQFDGTDYSNGIHYDNHRYQLYVKPPSNENQTESNVETIPIRTYVRNPLARTNYSNSMSNNHENHSSTSFVNGTHYII